MWSWNCERKLLRTWIVKLRKTACADGVTERKSRRIKCHAKISDGTHLRMASASGSQLLIPAVDGKSRTAPSRPLWKSSPSKSRQVTPGGNHDRDSGAKLLQRDTNTLFMFWKQQFLLLLLSSSSSSHWYRYHQYIPFITFHVTLVMC